MEKVIFKLISECAFIIGTIMVFENKDLVGTKQNLNQVILFNFYRSIYCLWDRLCQAIYLSTLDAMCQKKGLEIEGGLATELTGCVSWAESATRKLNISLYICTLAFLAISRQSYDFSILMLIGSLRCLLALAFQFSGDEENVSVHWPTSSHRQ